MEQSGGSNIEICKLRFRVNMRRIDGIIRLFAVGKEGEPRRNLTDDMAEVEADIARFTVVFLHATLEDFIRSNLPKSKRNGYNFHGKSDLAKAYRWLGIQPIKTEFLFAPLTRLAKSRNDIVHHADFRDDVSATVEGWGFWDRWLLAQFNLLVLAFYFGFLVDTGTANFIEERFSKNVIKALGHNRKFFEVFKNIDRTPLATPMEELVRSKAVIDEAADALNAAAGSLKFDLQEYIGPDGALLPNLKI
jgi:hypothetical protein